MTTRGEDRRVQRTRGLLQHALIELMLEKGYEAVTVQDIIDRANVGRSTFYGHFLDKERLLFSTLENLRALLLQAMSEAPAGAGGGSGEVRLGFSLAMFLHARDHHRLYRAIVGRQGGALVQQEIQRILGDLVRRELAPLVRRGAATPVPLEVVVLYTVSAFHALLTWWLNHDMPCAAEEIDRTFRALTLPGIKAALGMP